MEFDTVLRYAIYYPNVSGVSASFKSAPVHQIPMSDAAHRFPHYDNKLLGIAKFGMFLGEIRLMC